MTKKYKNKQVVKTIEETKIWNIREEIPQKILNHSSEDITEISWDEEYYSLNNTKNITNRQEWKFELLDFERMLNGPLIL